MVITQWEIQCLGIPIDNRTTTEKTTKKQVWAFDHGTGTPSIMQSVRHSIIDHFHVPLTIQFSCQHLDLWVGTCWIRASIRWAAFPPVAEEETWVYGVWGMRHFSSVVDEGEIFQFFYRYTTILNSGILKVIQFKDGTDKDPWVPSAEAFALRSRPSKNGGPTLTPQQLTGRLRTAETSNHVLFIVTWWQWPLEVVWVAVKAQRLTGWPFSDD